MNGLQITGMKISSPAPTKKIVPIKSEKVQSTANTTPIKKPFIPKITQTAAKKEQKTIRKQSKKPQQKPKIVQLVSPKQQQPKKQQKIEQVQKVIQEPTKQQIQSPVTSQYDVIVRYNHYKQKFIAINGILDFFQIDDKWGFNLVFKGNYIPVLKIYKSRQQIERDENKSKEMPMQKYTWKVEEGRQYGLQIMEDEQQESKRQKKYYQAPKQENCCPFKKNQRVQMLTNDMKKLSIDQLGSQKHRQMLEQRDLEDILFS